MWECVGKVVEQIPLFALFEHWVFEHALVVSCT